MEREDHEEDERGAGGKFRKPLARKPLSTPYSRTSSSSQTQQPQDGGGGSGSWWWSNLVSPASRLISSGVTRFFPSFLSKPLLSDAQQPGGGGGKFLLLPIN